MNHFFKFWLTSFFIKRFYWLNNSRNSLFFFIHVSLICTYFYFYRIKKPFKVRCLNVFLRIEKKYPHLLKLNGWIIQSTPVVVEVRVVTHLRVFNNFFTRQKKSPPELLTNHWLVVMFRARLFLAPCSGTRTKTRNFSEICFNFET